MATNKDYSRSVIAASDEVNEIFCEPCQNDGKQIEAEGFCYDCSEHLCRQCNKSHTRFKAFKNHVLESTDKTKRKSHSKDVCVERCGIHPTKIVEYFCTSCDILGCNACITINHRQCENIDFIPDIAKDLTTSEEFITFTRGLESKLESIQQAKERVKSNTNISDDLKKQAKKELKRQRDDINKFFDQLEADMGRRLEDIDKSNKQTLHAATQTADVIHNDLIQIETKVKANQGRNNNCELLILMKQSKKRFEEVDQKFQILRKENSIQSFALTRSNEVQNMFENLTDICRLRTARFVKEMNLDTYLENSYIGGLAIVQSHYLAILDDKNKSVKVFDTENTQMLGDIVLQCDYVWKITSGNTDQLAVLITFNRISYIQLLTVDSSGKINQGIKIKIERHLLGSFLFKGDQFYMIGHEKVVIVNMRGERLKEIDAVYATGIGLSPDGTIIYLANPNERTVTSMATDGRITAVYRDDTLESPEDLTVDNEGVVYVTGDDNIHQLSEDCNNIKVLIDNIYGTKITFCDKRRRLYVSCGTSVKILQIS